MLGLEAVVEPLGDAVHVEGLLHPAGDIDQRESLFLVQVDGQVVELLKASRVAGAGHVKSRMVPPGERPSQVRGVPSARPDSPGRRRRKMTKCSRADLATRGARSCGEWAGREPGPARKWGHRTRRSRVSARTAAESRSYRRRRRSRPAGMAVPAQLPRRTGSGSRGLAGTAAQRQRREAWLSHSLVAGQTEGADDLRGSPESLFSSTRHRRPSSARSAMTRAARSWSRDPAAKLPVERIGGGSAQGVSVDVVDGASAAPDDSKSVPLTCSA
ncbi:MAG: hypothetical protein KatS3mg109_0902 [Pirellulaceae bacterium]|nr:MAG: hypothetical protein KatS3mg109_0902 [Pirellulaceae bacterium]